MKRQRTFRPTGDRLETRDVPASIGIGLRIAPVAHATVASRLNTPFAHTLHVGSGALGRQLSSSRTVNTSARAASANLALNRLATNLGFNLGPNGASNLTVNQLSSVLNQLAAGSPLGNTNSLMALLRANINNPNLLSVVGNTTQLNVLRANINNPNLPSILSSGATGSLLNSGLNFPATLSSGGFGFGTTPGLGLNTNGLLGSRFGMTNGLLGSQFASPSLLSTGTGGFINFM